MGTAWTTIMLRSRLLQSVGLAVLLCWCAGIAHAEILLRGVAQVATGNNHTCARTVSGAVWCWGNNQFFQLGLGVGIPAQVFAVQLPTIASGAVSLDVGRTHSCAVMADGGLRCWGNNARGEVGTGAPGLESFPASVFPPGSAVAAVATGDQHTCAIVGAAREVRCWGANDAQQLGDGSSTDRRTPVAVLGLGGGILAIAAGVDHSCALESTGGVRCWGGNQEGQLGDGTFDPRAVPTPVIGLSGPVTSIAAGLSGTCARLASGGLMCWGTAITLGTGSGVSANTAQAVPALGSTVAGVAVGIGGGLSCSWSSSGAASCWGAGDLGQLGAGGFTDSFTPVPVFWLVSGVVGMDAGARHACAVRNTGVAECWGNNFDGELAAGTRSVVPRPRRMFTPNFVIGAGQPVSAGRLHTCAVNQSGGVDCWGLNSDGQLGTSDNDPRTEPTAVSGLVSGATAVGVGAAHSCAVVSGGVRCWGGNVFGQLGNNSTSASNVPVTVVGLSQVVAVASGIVHSCALTQGGAVWCWGDNGSGQLGNNSTTLSRVPVPVSGLGSGVVEIAVGGRHGCARLSSGALRCWGWNSEGQLGNGLFGTGNDQLVPITVNDFGGAGDATRAIGLGAGERHTCAVRPNGNLLCWGSNAGRQLGDGSTVARRTTPVLVGGALPQGWTDVDGGRDHTCATRDFPARLACWGSNSRGQQGTGAIGAPSNVPVAVVIDTPNAFATIDVGDVHSCLQTVTVLPGGTDLYCWGDDQYGQVGDGGRGYDIPGAVLSDFEVFADGFEGP
jgi:alpha-tubulin suppressor-like RCC1 family protein